MPVSSSVALTSESAKSAQRPVRASRAGGEGFALPAEAADKGADEIAMAERASRRTRAEKPEAPQRPSANDRTARGEEMRAAHAPRRPERRNDDCREGGSCRPETGEPAIPGADAPVATAEAKDDAGQTAASSAAELTAEAMPQEEGASGQTEALVDPAMLAVAVPAGGVNADHLAALRTALANGAPPPSDSAFLATLGKDGAGVSPPGLADGIGKGEGGKVPVPDDAAAPPPDAGPAGIKPGHAGAQQHAGKALEAGPEAGFRELLAQTSALDALSSVARDARPAEPITLPAARPETHGQGELRPTPLSALPIEIGLKAIAGAKRFDIRLDPPELGRVDVRLEFTDDGQVTATLTVDRVETASLLQRDARTLERAFDQAGLKTSDGAIDIRLSDRSADQGQRQAFDEQDRPRGRGPQVGAELSAQQALEAQGQYRSLRLGGVDLMV